MIPTPGCLHAGAGCRRFDQFAWLQRLLDKSVEETLIEALSVFRRSGRKGSDDRDAPVRPLGIPEGLRRLGDAQHRHVQVHEDDVQIAARACSSGTGPLFLHDVGQIRRRDADGDGFLGCRRRPELVLQIAADGALAGEASAAKERVSCAGISSQKVPAAAERCRPGPTMLSAGWRQIDNPSPVPGAAAPASVCAISDEDQRSLLCQANAWPVVGHLKLARTPRSASPAGFAGEPRL